MLSQKMQDALNAQINAELWSAYLYLSMSEDAQTKGLPGLSHWMRVQWKEEQDHAEIIEKYLHAQNARVVLSAIGDVPIKWDDCPEMLREALSHEEEVTAMINDLMGRAYGEHDFASMGRLQWLVDEQVEEEEQLRSLLSAWEMVEDDAYGRYEFDQHLLRRHYQRPDILC